MEVNNQPLAVDDKHKPEETNNFNLKWLVATVLAIWPWLLGSIICTLIIGNLYLRYTPNIYRCYAEILLADSKNGTSNGGGNEVADVLQLNNKKINVDNEIEIIKSRSTMMMVVAQMHLNVNYLVVGRLKTTELYDNKPFEFIIADSADDYYNCKVNVLGQDDYELLDPGGKTIHARWGDTVSVASGRRFVLKKTDMFNPGRIQYTISIQPIVNAAIDNAVEVSYPTKNATYLTLSRLDRIPQRSIDIINTLMDVYAKNNVLSRTRISDSTINFISRRIDKVDSGLTGIEQDIVDFRQKHNIANINTQAEDLVKANSDLVKDLAGLELELYVTEAISDNLNKMDEKSDKSIILPPSLLDNDGIASMMDKFNQLQIDIENSEIANTPKNPITKALIKQRNEIKRNIIESLASSKGEIEVKVDKMKKQLGIINSDIKDVPKVERENLDYARQQQIKQEIYLFLLKKREETEIEKAATVADASVINPAINAGVVQPNRPRILMMSFLLGMIIPFGVIMLRRALNIKIINKSDIVKLTKIPIVGEIGNNADTDPVAVKKNSRTIISEQFRALRTNLQYLFTERNEKVLLITSSMSGEGKSFIAINLSITLAMSGKKVVLMELDLRKPKISQTLGLDNNTGFSTYTIGRAPIDKVIIPSGVDPNLFIVPSGPIPPNPTELILLHRTEELFKYLRENYDYVIVDTSPLGLVTDAQLLDRYSDATLYIVRQGHTYKQQLNIPNELYVSGRMKKLSLIVNDMIANRGFAYGYGYEENYGYGYGYGYGGYGYGAYGGGYYHDVKKKGIVTRFRKKKDA